MFLEGVMYIGVHVHGRFNVNGGLHVNGGTCTWRVHVPWGITMYVGGFMGPI